MVDFVCLETKLIIERDGGHHAGLDVYDKHRTEILERNRLRVMRFWNEDILTHLEGVLLDGLLGLLLETPHPPLCVDLSHKGRG